MEAARGQLSGADILHPPNSYAKIQISHLLIKQTSNLIDVEGMCGDEDLINGEPCL